MKANLIRSLKIIILAFLMIAGTVFSGWVSLPAFANVYGNTNVIKDLQRDATFNAEDYPDKADDYSIKVLQVAESDKNELYLYTYQPCQKTTYLIATDVNMSLSATADGTKLYELIIVNTNGVFAKYLVKGVTVNASKERYYNITSVYRKWDDALDGEIENNNTGSKKAFAVGKVIKATTENGKKNYLCEPAYTVDIIDPYSDYLIYTDFNSLPAISSIRYNFEKLGFIDAHYIAFSTDWEIDRLKNATVTYQQRTGNGYYNTFLGFDCGGDLTYSNPQTGYAYPTYYEKVENSGNFWDSGTKFSYSWDRIQTVSAFIASEENLTDETKNNLSGKQWVIRFLETKRTQTETGVLGYKKYETNFTKVDSVGVLRLEFETDGICYNLGTVSDLVNGDGNPGNADKVDAQNFLDWLVAVTGVPAWVWITLAVIIPLAIALSVLSIFFPVVRVILRSVGKGLWLIISFPFRMLGKAIKAISERRAAAKAKPKAKPAKRKTAKKPKTKSKATKKGGKK